jgi:hypothetical protein
MKFGKRVDSGGSLLTSFNGNPVKVESIEGYSICASWTDTTPTDPTFLSGVLEVQTLTFPAFVGLTDRDYIVVYNQAGTSFAVYADKTGTSIAPTGAAYVAASFKVKANVSADTTAAEVAARFETAFNTLTGFTASVTTDDTAADGTMLLTQTVRGPTTNPVPHNLNDSGAGSIAGVQTTGGVATAVNPTANTITKTAHGLVTGLKVRFTTSSALPAPLLVATDYYVIKIDVDTIKLATSYANAIAGVPVIDITDFGTGTQTIDTTALVGAFKLQASNNAELDNVGDLTPAQMADPNAVWVDITGSSTAVAGSGSQFWNVSDVYYLWFRLVYTATSGSGDFTAYLNYKGIV